MYFLIAGSILFFAAHFYSSFRSRMPSRDVKKRMGFMKFMALFSLVAGVGLVLMIWGFGLARPSPQIFTPPTWGSHVTMALMLPSLIILLAAYCPHGYIKQAVKHPMLISIILWSAGHLFSNGELNSLILFGSFLAFALVDRLAVMERELPIKKPKISGDLLAILIGSAAYFLMLKYGHQWIIGVPII